jgi:small GTP-binding protein
MAEAFNEPQKSRILAGVSYIDKLLVEMEEILSASSSAAFPKYKSPLTPAQVRVIRDYTNRLRRQIAHVLKDLAIPLPAAKFDSAHAIRVTLQFIEVAIEELAPERLRGYGEVPAGLIRPLAGGLQEMKGIVRQLDSYLIQRPDADLNLRLARLSSARAAPELLSLLARIIDQDGLVEFRDPLSRLVEKMEAPTYEIAFFGRVSAGKSSLLNRIIGADLLPTGVTPVTAVPTRIRNRPEPALLVWTMEAGAARYDIDRLPDFVTEARNPGNEKRVTRLVAEIPLAMFPEEVVLVDTPGLGSLALDGAAETLAYLPQCDLGVVLVDASSNLHSDDVATVDALRAASVPSVVVLSKADLVSPRDLDELLNYTRNQISQQLGIEVPVAPLSSHPEMSRLLKSAKGTACRQHSIRNSGGHAEPVLREFLESWVGNEIAPRIVEARRLAEESNERKANNLAERVLRALEMSIKSSSSNGVASPQEDLKSVENRLREAAGLLESVSRQCFSITGRVRDAANDAVAAIVERAITIWHRDAGVADLDETWIQAAVNTLAQNEAQELANTVRRTTERLSEALNTTAQAITAGRVGEQFSLSSFVKELPAPDYSGCRIRLHRPRMLSVSSSLARRSVAHQIESHCGAALVEFFDSYGRALELWFRYILAGVEREFNSSAEIYRAQLQRLSAPGAAIQPDTSAVLEHISLLSQKLGVQDLFDAVQSNTTA